MGLFDRKQIDNLPPIKRYPETTFTVAGREYWLGMTVQQSRLRFVNERDAHKKLKPNASTSYADWWMADEHGNEFCVGFVNRGCETIEYQDAEIAFFNISSKKSPTSTSFARKW